MQSFYSHTAMQLSQFVNLAEQNDARLYFSVQNEYEYIKNFYCKKTIYYHQNFRLHGLDVGVYGLYPLYFAISHTFVTQFNIQNITSNHNSENDDITAYYSTGLIFNLYINRSHLQRSARILFSLIYPCISISLISPLLKGKAHIVYKGYEPGDYFMLYDLKNYVFDSEALKQMTPILLSRVTFNLYFTLPFNIALFKRDKINIFMCSCIHLYSSRCNNLYKVQSSREMLHNFIRNINFNVIAEDMKILEYYSISLLTTTVANIILSALFGN